MPLFGSKKKKEQQGTNIEAPEEDGIFMARSSEASTSDEAKPSDGESVEPELSDLESANEGETEPASDADEATAEPPAAAAKAEDESSADDLLAAFQDDETEGDVTDLTKDLEDVPIADLLADLREIRAMLPAEALEQAEDAA